jgi:hypothetical protein
LPPTPVSVMGKHPGLNNFPEWLQFSEGLMMIGKANNVSDSLSTAC